MDKLRQTKEEVIVWATLSEALYQIGINFRDDNFAAAVKLAAHNLLEKYRPINQ